MTETDVRIVEQNAHFTHYLYELLRLIEEGTPVTAFVEMGINSNTAEVEKRIASEVLRLKMKHTEKAECKFKKGDTIRCIKGFNEVNHEFFLSNTVKILDDDKLYDACILYNKDFSDKPIVVPTTIINENYILCNK